MKPLCPILLTIVLTALLPLSAFGEAVDTPSQRADCQHEHCYWTTPMDITDEEAVWAMLMAPMTVISGGQRDQISLLDAPGGQPIGEITCYSQGVHVLGEDENGWTKVEVYSSSFKKTKTQAWDALLQGYVETARLQTVQPAAGMGLVADKLTQRLYVFVEGKLYSTLLISTGLTNKKQPFNETRSGEYLIVSRVGGFYSDNMYCPRALRFNDGDLLHEVPYVLRNGNKIYSGTEPKLGIKASHGCIRVQRKTNPEGLNQGWLFANCQINTKILIWEDWQGRQIRVPEDDEIFWRHPSKGEYYHCSDHCPMLGSKTPQEITYGELSAEDSELKACPACGPVPKKSELLEINALYAEGGDHDPVLTEARKSCPRKLKGR